jgi:hypothetical protein
VTLALFGLCNVGLAQSEVKMFERYAAWSMSLKRPPLSWFPPSEDESMPQQKHRPEEIVAKLSQERSVAEAVHAISVTQFTYYSWRTE